MSGTVTKLKQALAAAATKAETFMRQAETDDRELTSEERTEVDALLAEARDLKARIGRAENNDAQQAELAQLRAFGELAAAGAETSLVAPPARVGSLGAQWVNSPAMDFFKRGAHRGPASWSSPIVELQAATLTTDPASGGALIVPQRQPLVLPAIYEVRVADLFAQGTTTAGSISYLHELTATNAAAAVAEGGVKPESALTFEAVTKAVAKVATWLPVSEEMLADVDQIRSYIDARLSLFVELKMDDQVLNGSGIAPNMLGLLNTPGLTPATAASDGEPNADAILRAAMTILGGSYFMPDAVVMNPADWTAVALMKDTSGRYIGPGVFGDLPAPKLWGLDAVPSPAIAQGTAVVGAFKQGGQFWRRSGIVVQASNSHADFFIKNLVAIRAEQRALLTVYRPAAFGTVTGLDSGLVAPVPPVGRAA